MTEICRNFHALVGELCAAFGGPVVSTSANTAGAPPARDADTVSHQFGAAVHVLDGPLGGHSRPSTIRDLRSGEVLRA